LYLFVFFFLYLFLYFFLYFRPDRGEFKKSPWPPEAKKKKTG
jgi:hypothetical protein